MDEPQGNVNLISHFICEAPGCGEIFPASYNAEFLELYEEAPESKKEYYFMSHDGCKHIPLNWSKVARSKHFILYTLLRVNFKGEDYD